MTTSTAQMSRTAMTEVIKSTGRQGPALSMAASRKKWRRHMMAEGEKERESSTLSFGGAQKPSHTLSSKTWSTRSLKKAAWNSKRLFIRWKAKLSGNYLTPMKLGKELRRNSIKSSRKQMRLSKGWSLVLRVISTKSRMIFNRTPISSTR